MSKATKSPGAARDAATGRFVVGKGGWAKISAVEGVTLTRGQKGEFREFDRRGLSAEERRREIVGKYGKKS